MSEHISTAARLTPILERVHGAHHPELTRVNELTQKLAESTDAEHIPVLFRELRSVTNNYAIPGDACEAYQEAFRALESADRLHAEV